MPSGGKRPGAGHQAPTRGGSAFQRGSLLVHATVLLAAAGRTRISRLASAGFRGRLPSAHALKSAGGTKTAPNFQGFP
jgi:hypothetical protein